MNELLESQDFVYVIYIGIAVGMFMLFTGFVQLVSRREQLGEAKSRRMKMIAKGRSTEEILALLKPEVTKGGLSGLPFIGDLGQDLRQAGILMRVRAFLLVCTVGAVMIFAFVAQLAGAAIGVAFAIMLGFLSPILFVKARRASREAKLVEQLPEALDLLARGLKVGHPLNTSIDAVGKEMLDPIATEFGIMFDQVSFGDDLGDAFSEFAERYPIEDVQYLAACVGIQHGTGGDLARFLQILSATIRGRIAMRRRIKSISAEGRLTAYFLSALPVLMYISTSIMAPDYYRGVADDPLYIPFAVVIVGLVFANALILRKLVMFRI